MAGQHEARGQVAHFEQGVEVVAERVGARIGIPADIGRDAWQDVVAAEEEAVFAKQAHVVIGVAGGPDDAVGVGAEVEIIAVV